MRPMLSYLFVALLAAPAAAQSPPDDIPEVPTIPRDEGAANYRLTMEKVRKTLEVLREFNAVAERHPELVEQVNRDQGAAYDEESGPDVAAGAERLEKFPPLREMFRKSGMSAKEFFLASTALSSAMVALQIKQGRLNPQAASPPETPAEKANLALLEANQAEWKKLEPAYMEAWDSSPWLQ